MSISHLTYTPFSGNRFRVPKSHFTGATHPANRSTRALMQIDQGEQPVNSSRLSLKSYQPPPTQLETFISTRESLFAHPQIHVYTWKCPHSRCVSLSKRVRATPITSRLPAPVIGHPLLHSTLETCVRMPSAILTSVCRTKETRVSPQGAYNGHNEHTNQYADRTK